jgi:virginiamycin B lyase
VKLRAWPPDARLVLVIAVVFGVSVCSVPAVSADTDVRVVTKDAAPTLGELADIKVGPNGKLWFTSELNNRVGWITPRGELQTFQIRRTPDGATPPMSIAPTADGTVWVTDEYMGRLHHLDVVAGTLQSFDPPCAHASDVTEGPDGQLWFACVAPGVHAPRGVGRLSPQGTNGTAFRARTRPCDGSPFGNSIAFDRTGNVWFACGIGDAVGRLTVRTGTIKMFHDRRINDARGITLGPDHNLWFTSWSNNRVGRITPEGKITLFAGSGIVAPNQITAGADGNLWFTSLTNDRIGKITAGRRITSFDGSAHGVNGSNAIAARSDGNLWFTTNDRIGRITPTGKITTYPRL